MTQLGGWWHSQVPAQVAYLDRSGAMGFSDPASVSSVDIYKFIPEACPQGTEPYVSLLYRPGHYDILYRQ
jgi:hypothetical protein